MPMQGKCPVDSLRSRPDDKLPKRCASVPCAGGSGHDTPEPCSEEPTPQMFYDHRVLMRPKGNSSPRKRTPVPQERTKPAALGQDVSYPEDFSSWAPSRSCSRTDGQGTPSMSKRKSSNGPNSARRSCNGPGSTPLARCRTPTSPQVTRESPNGAVMMWEDQRRSMETPSPSPKSKRPASSLDVVATFPPRRNSSISQGLGALQPEGRDEVLQKWQKPGDMGGGAVHRRNRSSSTCSAYSRRGVETSRETDPSQRRLADMIGVLRNSTGSKTSRTKGVESPRLEWSSLTAKAKKAIQLWYNGNLGGRHCLLLLEHDAAVAFFISPLDLDEVNAADLKGSAVLGALSGLSEVGGCFEGGWLHDEVFAKNPKQVLEEALLAACENSKLEQESNGSLPSARTHRSVDPNSVNPHHLPYLSSEQVNLALRQMSLKAQGEGMRSLIDGRRGRQDGPRFSEEFLRIQVWLELVRMHVEGVVACVQEVSRENSWKDHGSSRRSSSNRSQSVCMSPSSARLWGDDRVIDELGKSEANIKTESESMSMETLRTQNRSIEVYLMRLVRQRDQLKRVAKLAEECDSYLILGLDGPDATKDEVKRAYHTLARKEHPDKAGVDNKERFQSIQQAYSKVMRRHSRIVSGEKPDTVLNSTSLGAKAARGTNEVCPSAFLQEATKSAQATREAAHVLAGFANDAFQLKSLSSEARNMTKRSALRELQSLAKRSIVHLKEGASSLRVVKDACQSVAESAQHACIEYGEWVETAMAGAGLKERADVMETIGASCLTTAGHLDKLWEADEATLQKIETASHEIDVTCGCRILSDNLIQTASIVRCAADEGIGAATTAFELVCSLAVLERLRRRETAENEAEASKDYDEDESHECQANKSKRSPGSGSPRKPQSDDLDQETKEEKQENSSASSDGGQGTLPVVKGQPETSKEKMAALRTRHLQCLGGLNEEVLNLQRRLTEMLTRSEGLTPAVGANQKGCIFDLVAQFLQSAVAEAARMAESATPSQQILEKCFAFALALEHASQVALAAEAKTQALKLAALLDVDLLCQIIEGPFKRRLLHLEKLRPLSTREREKSVQLECDLADMILDRSARGIRHASVNKSWSDVVHSVCSRIAAGLRRQVDVELVARTRRQGPMTVARAAGDGCAAFGSTI